MSETVPAGPADDCYGGELSHSDGYDAPPALQEIDEFEARVQALPPSPNTIRFCLDWLSELPGESMHTYESNRRDAIQLTGLFGTLRELIHERRPEVHEVITAMVDYYDDAAHDPRRLQEVVNQLAGEATTYLHEGLVFDLERYDALTKGGFVESAVMPDEQAIDVLRRLQRNTRPVDCSRPPVLQDEYANQRLEWLAGAPDSQQRHARLQKATDYCNDRLMHAYEDGADTQRGEEYGVHADLLREIAWVETKQFEYLQQLAGEDQIRLAKQPLYQSILLMHDLTHNYQFDRQEWQAFLDRLVQQGDHAARQMVFDRVIAQVQQCAADYHDQPGRKDRLWSGVTGRLLDLYSLRPAKTAAGQATSRPAR